VRCESIALWHGPKSSTSYLSLPWHIVMTRHDISDAVSWELSVTCICVTVTWHPLYSLRMRHEPSTAYISRRRRHLTASRRWLSEICCLKYITANCWWWVAAAGCCGFWCRLWDKSRLVTKPSTSVTSRRTHKTAEPSMLLSNKLKTTAFCRGIISGTVFMQYCWQSVQHLGYKLNYSRKHLLEHILRLQVKCFSSQ